MSTAPRTRSARSSRTPAPPLTTRDTVLRLTPATAATSRMVGRRARGRAADSELTARIVRVFENDLKCLTERLSSGSFAAVENVVCKLRDAQTGNRPEEERDAMTVGTRRVSRALLAMTAAASLALGAAAC